VAHAVIRISFEIIPWNGT